METELQTLRNALTLAQALCEQISQRLVQLELPGPSAYLRGPHDPDYKRDHTEHRAAITPNVPPGYDTVLGYLAKYHPDVLDTVDYWDPEVTKRDGFKLSHWQRQLCKAEPVQYVDAPPCLRAAGIERVRAYPVELLAKRWG